MSADQKAAAGAPSTEGTANQPIVREAGEGRLVEALGARITLRAMSEETGGRYGCVEYLAPPGFGGPPPHAHGFDEVFYVLEGEFTFRLGDRTVRAGAGALVCVPGHVTHTFANPGQSPAKFLGFVIPGGFERYFLELPDLIARHGYPPPPQVMAELSRKYDVTVPPPQ